MKKRCIACGEEKEPTEFYRHPQMADGRSGRCKECQKANVKLNYDKNRARRSAYERDREQDPHRKQQKAEARRRYIEKNPEKVAARAAVYSALRSGKITKLPCSCGSTDVQAHHADYSRPLDIEWVCFKCHREGRHGQIVTADSGNRG